MTVQNLKGVAEEFKTNPKVQLASISIAPKSDSAKALAEFGEKQGLLTSKWNLLRGSVESIKELALKYFFSPVMMEGEGLEPLHSERAYLVDPIGNLRGTYYTSKPSDMKRLLTDINKLLLETE
jgi:protein SCO1/2